MFEETPAPAFTLEGLVLNIKTAGELGLYISVSPDWGGAAEEAIEVAPHGIPPNTPIEQWAPNWVIIAREDGGVTLENIYMNTSRPFPSADDAMHWIVAERKAGRYHIRAINPFG